MTDKNPVARWTLLVVALAVLGIIALAVANHVYGQDVPEDEPKTGEEWAHDQYVTKLEAAQAENARIREARAWSTAEILAFIACAVAFGKKSRALQAVIEDQRRHSTVHDEFRETIGANETSVAELTAEVRAGFAKSHADIEGLSQRIDDFARYGNAG